jgi:hypothetical protein
MSSRRLDRLRAWDVRVLYSPEQSRPVLHLACCELERVGSKNTIPVDSPRQLAQLEDISYADAETHDCLEE